MLHALRDLGKIIIKEVGQDPEKILSYFVDKSDYEDTARKESPLIFSLNFKTEEDCFTLEEICEADSKSVEKFLWIGNARSASPQNRLTTNNLSYLLSKTIPALLDIRKGLPRNSTLTPILSGLRERFFRRAEEFGVKGKDGKALIIDIGKFKSFSEKLPSLSQTSDFKELLKEMTNVLTNDLEQKIGSKVPKASLFTVYVDGEPLVKNSEYHRYIYNFYFQEPFEESRRGRCHLCGKEGKVTKEYSATRFRFAYYIMDKISFASGISEEGFYKNFSLCEDCYSALLIAEKFVWQNLHSSLGGRDFCLIPSFLLYSPLTVKELERLSSYIKGRFRAVESLMGYNQFREKLNEYVEEKEQSKAYTLDLLFYFSPPGSSEFRILKLIEDVSPSRLDILNEVINEVHSKANELLGESSKWYIGLECINGLLASPQPRVKAVHYRYLLDFYEALLLGSPVEYKPLIGSFAERAGEIKYLPDSSDRELVFFLLQTNLLLEILRQLNILKGGDFQTMNLAELRVPENIRAYMEEIGLDEPKGAIFLLGYLVGEIGNEQYHSGSSNKKPILEKITFQGMNPGKLVRLANDVFDKLKQYGLLDYERETLHSAMKRLMDKNIDRWRLSDQENVYWLLSGYAFATLERISEKRENPPESGETSEKEEMQNE